MTTWDDPTSEISADFPARASSVRKIQANITAALEGAEGAPRARAPMIAGTADIDARPTPAADGSMAWRQPGYAYLSGGSSASATTQTITNYSTTNVRHLTYVDGKVTIPRTATYRVTLRYLESSASSGNMFITVRRNSSDMSDFTRTIEPGDAPGEHIVTVTWIGSLNDADELLVRGNRGVLGDGGKLQRISLIVEDF